MQEHQRNLIYLDGPHGSGKTTFGEELAKENPQIMIPELFSRNIKFHTEPAYRQVLKIASRAIENFEYLQTAKQNPDRIVLANRGIYGVLAYNWVYSERGWISRQTYEIYGRHTGDFFKHENTEPFSVVLNPGFEVVRKHLMKRWKEKGKKWNEEDMEYTRLACKAYERFQGQERIFYIDHEIDLENRMEIQEAGKWIERVSGIRREESRALVPV